MNQLKSWRKEEKGHYGAGLRSSCIPPSPSSAARPRVWPPDPPPHPPPPWGLGMWESTGFAVERLNLSIPGAPLNVCLPACVASPHLPRIHKESGVLTACTSLFLLPPFHPPQHPTPAQLFHRRHPILTFQVAAGGR